MLAAAHIGLVLQGTYRIERPITSGGMGTLYEASHLRLSRRFAVKILSPTMAVHPEALKRFQREADVTSALGHPNILEVVDFNKTEDGIPYIVMELLEGEDLGQRLERVERLSLAEAGGIFSQVASALTAAHAQGIVHRDLKPPNIFLCRRAGRDDFVKVVDFGISKVLGNDVNMTRTNVILGSPAHMAPEQAAGRPSEVDERSDIYALGAILYEMLSGQPPLMEETLPKLLDLVLTVDPAPLRSLRPEVPAAIEAAVARALRKRREDRFQTMPEFADSVERALEARRGEAARSGARSEDEAATDTRGPIAGPLLSLSSGESTVVSAPPLMSTVAGGWGPPPMALSTLTGVELGFEELAATGKHPALEEPEAPTRIDRRAPVADPPATGRAGGPAAPPAATSPARTRGRPPGLRPFLLGAATSAAIGLFGFLVAFLISRSWSEEPPGVPPQPPAASAPTVRLALPDLPAGARVLVDGVVRPERPVLLRSGARVHLVVEASGYQRKEQILSLTSDATLPLKLAPR
jgi:serine/threonine-protein kinase